MKSASLTRGRRPFAACALAGAIAIGLSACGSSGSPASASSGGTSTSSSSSRTAARLKFVECMRSHGVNLPDPSSGGGFGGAGAGGTSTTGAPPGGGAGGFRALLTTPTGQAAEKACAKDLGKAFGGFAANSAQRAQFQADAVKFAECMRAHNINIPDPTSTSGGGFGIFRDLRGSSETNSPAFKTAMTACSSDLPHRPGAGGPGGGGNSVGGPGA